MIADMMTAMIQKKWASDVLTPLSGEASSPSVAIPVIPPFRRRRLTLLRRDRKVKRWGAARAVSAQHQPCLGEPFKPLVDETGKAHVCTPVTNTPLESRLQLEKKNHK